MTLVLHRDQLTMKYCNKGTRLFFERHGLSHPDFVRDGLPAEALEATGDAMALELVAEARRREAESQDQEQQEP